MSNKEEIKNGYNYISRPFMHPDLISLSIAYKEAIEALMFMHDYFEGYLADEKDKEIKDILNKAPEDL